MAGLASSLCLGAVPPALAQDREPRPEPVLDVPPSPPDFAARRKRGTHFFAELQAGAPMSAPSGPSGALLLGGGGKMPGSPLRVYFITEFGMAARSGQQPGDAGQLLWLAPGLRLYLPLPVGLRVFAELSAGAVYLRDEVIAGRSDIYVSRWETQLTIAGGLQYRFIRELSVGARMAHRFVDDTRQDTRLRQWGGWTPTGSVTWHF